MFKSIQNVKKLESVTCRVHSSLFAFSSFFLSSKFHTDPFTLLPRKKSLFPSFSSIFHFLALSVFSECLIYLTPFLSFPVLSPFSQFSFRLFPARIPVFYSLFFSGISPKPKVARSGTVFVAGFLRWKRRKSCIFVIGAVRRG
ncbi:hypothetical protein VNO77_18667 [Canavalia gladiata]|uniref:Transmembrane protein n=1 Tax=Canavalia gladiata TaxID=3824 RepID=A0AAN9LL69_CANGL